MPPTVLPTLHRVFPAVAPAPQTPPGQAVAEKEKHTMAAKNVLKYRLVAVIEGQKEYDPERPSSYTEALEYAAEKKRKVEELGATVDARVWPSKVRE